MNVCRKLPQRYIDDNIETCEINKAEKPTRSDDRPDLLFKMINRLSNDFHTREKKVEHIIIDLKTNLNKRISEVSGRISQM